LTGVGVLRSQPTAIDTGQNVWWRYSQYWFPGFSRDSGEGYNYIFKLPKILNVKKNNLSKKRGGTKAAPAVG
jgi:hypothetical protein